MFTSVVVVVFLKIGDEGFVVAGLDSVSAKSTLFFHSLFETSFSG